MDKEEDKDHAPPDNERSSTEDCLPELKKKEKAKRVIKTIQWTTGNNFTVERGRQQIEELISHCPQVTSTGQRESQCDAFIRQTWDIHKSWLHHSEFLEEEELKDSKRYHYRACWGIPTRRKPIPRATASVYFVIVISKLKPDTSPVEVFFRLESSRLIRRPEECQFREKWLQDIIENKIILIERLGSQ
ncbi:A-kinase anchor protein 14 isoform X2 [Neopelma chrysocephalum]|uniref:A-kinase anchor protein 14 isoform X2 n=1 Tax=Neopelma chrysocephalum TaxID=114329 RepID=UPI000FCCE3DA|nr:A-kinase anchor protein 14 isoform X2 [Neopelma chrysocephalum]